MAKKTKKTAKKKVTKKTVAKQETNSKPRTVTVGKQEWPRKKAALMRVLQKQKGEIDRAKCAVELAKMGENEDKINVYSYKLQEEKFVRVMHVEGKRGNYRIATKKGLALQIKL